MNTTHTPGPWLFGLSNRNNEAAIIGDIDSVVCYLPDASTGCTFKPADARLIATAPMLLEALTSIVDGGLSTSRIAAARAAIAAAIGETK